MAANTETLAKALLEFQADAPAIHLDSTNPHFRNRYASLAGVVAAVRPALNKVGIVYTQLPTVTELGQPAVETRLIHAPSGEALSSVMPLILVKQAPQGQGAALTYARRFALLSVLGLVGDEDDDGEAASNGKPDAAAQTATRDSGGTGPTEKQRKLIFALLNKLQISESHVVTAYGARVVDLERQQASDLIERLKAKEAEFAHIAPGEVPQPDLEPSAPDLELDIPF